MDEFFADTSIRNIKKALTNKKLTIFVGAGVSRNSDCPSWNEVIKELSKDLGMENEFEKDQSVENYLKIAEMYYIEREEKEYLEKIKSLFPTKYKPNKIHEILMKLAPQNFITTNYDPLIEISAKENLENYSIVRKNRELAYTTSEKLLIKMHGDFDCDNFVLKESDYLSYSSKFSLIENKIKELLSTNIVLFVGYSVSDYDFKIIMQLVKDTLKNDFQNAYLIEVGKKYNRREFDYYKNRGVNIIYYSDLKLEEKGYKNISENYHYSNLYNALKYIYEYKGNIDYLHRFLLRKREVEEFKYLGVRGIAEFLEDFNFMKYGNGIIDDSDEKIGENLRDLKYIRNNLKELKEIREFFVNNDVSTIQQNTGENLFINKKAEVEIPIFSHYQYQKIVENKSYKNKMEKAYCYYKINDFQNAYDCLREVRFDAKMEKNYITLFIAELSLKTLGKIIEFQIRGQDNIKNEISKINIIDTIRKIPNNYDFLRKIENFEIFYHWNKEIMKIGDNIKNMKDTFEYGGTTSGDIVEKIREEVRALYKFIILNNLFMERYDIIKDSFYYYIKYMFIYSTIKPNRNKVKQYFKNEFYRSLDDEESFKVKIDITEIFYMLNFLDYTDVRKIEKKYNADNIEIEDKDKVIKYLLDEFNYFSNAKTNEMYINKRYTVFEILLIFRWSKEEISFILESILEQLDELTFMPLVQYLNRVIVKNKESIDSEKILKPLYYFAIKMLNSKDSYDVQLNLFISSVDLMIKSKIEINEEEILEFTISLTNKIYRNYILKNMYLIFEDKSKIVELAKRIINDEDDKDLLCFFIVYKEIKDNIKDFIDGCYKNLNDDNLSYLESLACKEIIDIKEVSMDKLQNKSKLLVFISDMKSFDVGKIEISWLSLLSLNMIEKIKEEEKIYEQVIKLLRDKIVETTDDEVKKKYLDLLFDKYRK